jgi:hypothetical protein
LQLAPKTALCPGDCGCGAGGCGCGCGCGCGAGARHVFAERIRRALSFEFWRFTNAFRAVAFLCRLKYAFRNRGICRLYALTAFRAAEHVRLPATCAAGATAGRLKPAPAPAAARRSAQRNAQPRARRRISLDNAPFPTYLQCRT